MLRNVTGVILAGGLSRRFGANKALAPWGGKKLVEHMEAKLSPLFPEVLVLAKNRGDYGFLRGANVRVEADLLPENHPLGGIFSALSLAGTKSVFVCGCDMPLLDPELVRRLWKAGRRHDAAVPVWNLRLEPLCGIYSKNCAPAIDAMLREGCFKIQELFNRVRTRFFLHEEVQAVDPAGLSFMDIDTRRDFKRVGKARREAAAIYAR